MTDRATLFQVQAHGSPGSASIVGIDQAFSSNEVGPDLDGCFEAADLRFVGGSSENSLVAVFNDLSILNMITDSESLEPSFSRLDSRVGRFDATVQIEFTGGLGCFEGVWGSAKTRLTSHSVGPIELVPSVYEPSTLGSEVDTLTGTVHVK